jgi:hypothetical protein
MQWTWLRTLLLGLMIGPGSVTADTADTDAAEAERTPSGYAVRGANFYVWDEDARSGVGVGQGAPGLRAEPGEGADLGALMSALYRSSAPWLISA